MTIGSLATSAGLAGTSFAFRPGLLLGLASLCLLFISSYNVIIVPRVNLYIFMFDLLGTPGLDPGQLFGSIVFDPLLEPGNSGGFFESILGVALCLYGPLGTPRLDPGRLFGFILCGTPGLGPGGLFGSTLFVLFCFVLGTIGETVGVFTC